MPAEDRGLAHRHVVLVVLARVGERVPPVPFDEQPGLLQVARLAGGAGEFGQRDFDLGVAADPLDAAGAEDLADVVGGAAREPDEVVLAVRAQAGDTGLDEVSVAVELVAPFKVGVARCLAGVAEHGVEVAVVLLGGGDPCGEPGELGFQPGEPVRPISQAIASASL